MELIAQDQLNIKKKRLLCRYVCLCIGSCASGLAYLFAVVLDKRNFGRKHA